MKASNEQCVTHCGEGIRVMQVTAAWLVCLNGDHFECSEDALEHLVDNTDALKNVGFEFTVEGARNGTLVEFAVNDTRVTATCVATEDDPKWAYCMRGNINDWSEYSIFDTAFEAAEAALNHYFQTWERESLSDDDRAALIALYTIIFEDDDALDESKTLAAQCLIELHLPASPEWDFKKVVIGDDDDGRMTLFKGGDSEVTTWRIHVTDDLPLEDGTMICIEDFHKAHSHGTSSDYCASWQDAIYRRWFRGGNIADLIEFLRDHGDDATFIS